MNIIMNRHECNKHSNYLYFTIEKLKITYYHYMHDQQLIVINQERLRPLRSKNARQRQWNEGVHLGIEPRLKGLQPIVLTI